MVKVTQTELRNHIRKYLDQVEQGETLQVLRNGKPIATVLPQRMSNKEYWRNVKPLDIKGVSLSRAIIEEREKGM
jgi:prevent-host-death family protein